MFVEAFSPSANGGWSSAAVAPPLPVHRTNALFGTATSNAPAAAAAAELMGYGEESKRHVVTVPSFLPADGSDHAYPSTLHRIHVLPFLTRDESATLLEMARAHATENRSWDQQDSSRHVSYQTVDFAIEESIEISQYLGAGGIKFQDRIFGELSAAYGVDTEDLSFLDLFIASYEVKGGEKETSDSDEERNTMDRLDFHRDGSLLSFTVLLSPPEEFEGGGTIFDALRDVTLDDCDGSSVLQPPGVIQPPQAGYATLHSGKLLHGGHAVTEGQRIVLVGFVDVHERNIKPGALGSATKEWGRNDVRAFWNQRRSSLLERQRGNAEQPMWKLKNWRYLPKDTKERRARTNEGRSHLGESSIVPIATLRNIESRASPDRIRRRRLATEDALLREILLPRGERGEKVEEEEGEWIEVDLDSFGGLELGWH